MKNNNIRILQNLGFSEIESIIYLYLVQHGSGTGYNVSKNTGKSVSNVYNALAEMENKGFILSQNSNPKIYMAVPFNQLADRFTRKLSMDIVSATNVLKKYKPIKDDYSIYTIQNEKQVIEKSINMLKRSDSIVLIDIYPAIPKELKRTIINVAESGVQVYLKTYDSEGIKDIKNIYYNMLGSFRWPGKWLNLSVDFKEIILSYLRSSDHNNSIWSKNPLLCKIYSDALVLEMFVDKLINDKSSKVSQQIRNNWSEFNSNVNRPEGYRSFYTEDVD